MRKLFFSVIIFVYLGISSLATGAEWDRCKVCHRPSGQPAPSKTTLLKKFKTIEELIAGAKNAQNMMMDFVRDNEDIIAKVGKEIGVGLAPKTGLLEDEREEINPKKIVETRCTQCHNINRIVFAPNYSTGDWLHIIQRMEEKQPGLLTSEELVAVTGWLYENHQRLVPVEKAEVPKNIPKKQQDFITENRCTVCHTADRILEQAGAWTEKDWDHILKRMRAKAPFLLKDQISSHLTDTFGRIEESAPQQVSKLGDIYFRFYGSSQLSAEYRHDYDFNDELDDDNPEIKKPGKGIVLGTYSNGGQRRVHGFMEGKGVAHAEVFDPDKWVAHVGVGVHFISDEGNDTLDDNWFRDESNAFEVDAAFEEGWLGFQLPYRTSVRVGLQDYQSDFIGSIYHDTDLGARVYGVLGKNIEWSLYGARRMENDLLSGFNDDDDRDQELVIAHSMFKIGETLFMPSIHYNNDSEGDHEHGRTGTPINASGLPVTLAGDVEYDRKREEVNAFYLGFTTYGPLGPFKMLTGLYGVVGDQENGSVQGVDLRNTARLLRGLSPDKSNDYNIKAFTGYVDIAYPVQESLLLHTGYFYASGDDDPLDNDAEGFDAISDEVNIWGDRGVVIDDRLQFHVPALGPFKNGKSINSITVVRDDSPYTSLRDSDANSNFINPGVQAYNFGATSNPLTWLSINSNFTYFWWAHPDTVEEAIAAVNFVNTGAVNKVNMSQVIGYELSVDANFTLNKKTAIFSGAAVFCPDESLTSIYAENDEATNFVLGVQYKF
jgi:hypothetical protein